VVALASLLAATTLFGLCGGLFDWLTGATGRRAIEVVFQAVLGVWWGLTIGGFFIVLWPLAFASHWLLWRLEWEWSD
jgi:hypothetical protein